MKRVWLLLVLSLCAVTDWAVNNQTFISRFGSRVDSAWTLHIVNGSGVSYSKSFLIDSLKETIGLVDGAFNQVVRLACFYGTNRPVMEYWSFDFKLIHTNPESFRTPAYWMDEIDSVTAELWYDQGLSTRRSWLTNIYSKDTSWTAYPGKRNQVYYDIYFKGQTAHKMEFGWYIDTTQTAGTITSPTGYVTTFIDVGTGWLDSVTYQMIPRNQLELVLFLVSPGIVRYGNTAIVSREWRKKTDVSGRATWVVPANNALTPRGSFYELTYNSRDSYTYQYGIIKRFVLDTAVTVVNVMDAKEVR